MNATKKAARIAGLSYILVSLFGFFGLMYIPGKLIVSNDAAATAHNILSSEFLFRLGIVSEIVGTIGFFVVTLLLYELLKAVNKNYAVLMVTLFALSIPISFLGAMNSVAALSLLHGGSFLSAFSQPELNALAMLFLNLRDYSLTVAAMFWGLWLFPFGILMFKSRMVPRVLGILLIIAGIAYIVNSLTSLLFPAYSDIVFQYASILFPGELVAALWLLIMGAKERPEEAQNP